MEAQTAISISESLGYNFIQHKDMKLWMLIFEDITFYMPSKLMKQLTPETFIDYLRQVSMAYGQYVERMGPPTIH